MLQSVVYNFAKKIFWKLSLVCTSKGFKIRDDI